MHQLSKVVHTKEMLTQAIHIWWKANDFFIVFHFAARAVPMVLLTLSPQITRQVNSNSSSIASSSMSREFSHFESCCRASALLATLSYTRVYPCQRTLSWHDIQLQSAISSGTRLRHKIVSCFLIMQSKPCRKFL